jgi:hypothetical protein
VRRKRKRSEDQLGEYLTEYQEWDSRRNDPGRYSGFSGKTGLLFKQRKYTTGDRLVSVFVFSMFGLFFVGISGVLRTDFLVLLAIVVFVIIGTIAALSALNRDSGISEENAPNPTPPYKHTFRPVKLRTKTRIVPRL